MRYRYLITGTAGFIGFHVAQALLKDGNEVLGIDNLNPYYAPVLKQARHQVLSQYPNFQCKTSDLCDLDSLNSYFQTYQPTIVCHLAAQPGVRYSLKNPWIYVKNNLEAFVNVLEMAKQYHIQRLVYASSSSVYGNVTEIPYHEDQRIETPISLYASTKRSNELIAYTYTHIYGIQTIGLRFFTVYGPWGRPDMAIWKFCDAIVKQQIIPIYNYGKNFRDFTYVTDIVQGILSALHTPELANYEIFNLGNHQPENTLAILHLLEAELQMQGKIQLLPAQPGDMETTFANIDKAKAKLGFYPKTNIVQGIHSFVTWFQEHLTLAEEVRKIGCLG